MYCIFLKVKEIGKEKETKRLWFCAKKIYPVLFIEQGSISNLTTFPNLTQSNTVKIRKQKLCNFYVNVPLNPSL
jgi:hypothetical protein